MKPSILVIASTSLGRSLAVILSYLVPKSVLLVDTHERRAELMSRRLFCLDFGTEFSTHQEMLMRGLKDVAGNLGDLSAVEWVFCFEDVSLSQDLQMLRSLMMKSSGARWISCHSVVKASSVSVGCEMSFPWRVEERFIGRLKVRPTGSAVEFAGDVKTFSRLQDLLGRVLTLQTEPPKAPDVAWKAWGNQF